MSATQKAKEPTLTMNDLQKIRVALQLRVECAEDNNDQERIAYWSTTHEKIKKIIKAKY